jgi:hypothetical protein
LFTWFTHRFVGKKKHVSLLFDGLGKKKPDGGGVVMVVVVPRGFCFTLKMFNRLCALAF